MRNRVLLSAGAIALLAASCAQPEPQVLSEAPRSATTADLTTPSTAAEEEVQPGRFIARCAIEADGGTPGMTYFTDGSQNVTDHCLSRYYIGVQPAPGALYVPDEDAGSLAPTRESTTPETSGSAPQWTPAQPRTDEGAQNNSDEDPDRPGDDSSTTETEEPDTGETSTDDTESPTPGETTPTSPPTTPTDPTDPGTSEPGTDESGDAGRDRARPHHARIVGAEPPDRGAHHRSRRPPGDRARAARLHVLGRPGRITRFARLARSGYFAPRVGTPRCTVDRPSRAADGSAQLTVGPPTRLRPRSSDAVGPHASRGERRRPRRCRS